MPVSPGEFISKVQEDRGFQTRGQAIEYLLDLRRRGSKVPDSLPGLKEVLDKEGGYGTAIKRTGLKALEALQTPFEFGADIVDRRVLGGKGFKSPYQPGEEAEQHPDISPAVPKKVPIIGGMSAEDFISGTVGSAPIFSAAEEVAAPLAARLAGRVAGVAPDLMRGIAAGGSPSIEGAVPQLARARAIEAPLRLGMAGAGTGAVESPGSPYTGAAVGGVLGAGAGALHLVMSKPLQSVRLNPEVKKALDFVMRLNHETEDQTIAKLRTVGGLQAKLAEHPTAPAMDVMRLYTPDEQAQAFQMPLPSTTQPPEAPQASPYNEAPQPVGPKPAERSPEFWRTYKRPVVTERKQPVIQSPREYEEEVGRGSNQLFKQLTAPEKPIQQRVTELRDRGLNVGAIRTKLISEGYEPDDVKGVGKVVEQAVKVEAETEKKAVSELKRPFARKTVEAASVAEPLPDYSAAQEGVPTETGQVFQGERTPEGVVKLQKVKQARGKLRQSLIDKLKEEKGSVGSIPGPLPPNVPGYGISLEDSGDIVTAHDIAPDRVFADEGSANYLSQMKKRTGGVIPWSLRQPASVAAQDEAFSDFYKGTIQSRDLYRIKLTDRFHRRWFGKDGKGGIKARLEADNIPVDDFVRAFEGWKLSTDSTGKAVYTQTQLGLSKEAEALGLEFKKRIEEPIKQIVSGVDRRAHTIFEGNNLKWTPKQIQRIRNIQEGRGGTMRNVSMAEQQVARDTVGMLRYDGSHDLKMPQSGGLFSLMPVSRMRAVLENEMEQLKKQIAVGTDPTMIQKMSASLQARSLQLQKLEDVLAQRKTAFPGQSILPKGHYWGPEELSKEPAADGFLVDKNIDQIVSSFIHDALNKRHFDLVLYDASQSLPGMSDRDMQQYAISWLDGLRGTKGFREDAYIRRAGTALKGMMGKGEVAEEGIREGVSTLTKLLILTRLSFSPHFAMLTAIKPHIAIFPLVEPRVYGRALARGYADTLELMKGGAIRRDNAWVRARLSGVLGPETNKLLEEIDTLKQKGVVGRNLDTLIRNWPLAKLSEFTIGLERVIGHEAGIAQALEPGFKPHPVVKPHFLDPDKVAGLSRSSIRRAREYGRAMVEATKYIATKETKPTALSGGAIRNMMGLFKTFSISHATNMYKALEAGEYKTFGKYIGAMLLFGGLPAFPLYESARSILLSKYGRELPRYNGFSGMAEKIGLGAWLPTDLQFPMHTMGLPRELTFEEVGQNVAGPVFGALGSVGKVAAQEGLMTPQTMRAVGNATIGSDAMALIDAYNEMTTGTVEGPGGKPIAQDRPTGSVVASALHMTPHIRQEYYDARRDLKDALKYGDPSSVGELRDRFRDKGLVFTERQISAIKAEIKRETKRHAFSR